MLEVWKMLSQNLGNVSKVSGQIIHLGVNQGVLLDFVSYWSTDDIIPPLIHWGRLEISICD